MSAGVLPAATAKSPAAKKNVEKGDRLEGEAAEPSVDPAENDIDGEETDSSTPSSAEEKDESRGGSSSGKTKKLSMIGREFHRRTSQMLSTINTKMKRSNSRGLQNVGIASTGERSAANTTSTGFFSPPSFQLTQIIHDAKCFLPRLGHACVPAGGDILIFGGTNTSNSVTNDFLRYLPGMNVFEPIKGQGDTPSARAYCTIVPWVAAGAAREQLLLFGGFDNSVALSSTYKFDLSTRTWSAVQTMNRPPARYGHVSVVSGNKVYIHGGYTGDSVLDDMWEFDGSEWAKVKYRPPRGAPAPGPSDKISMPARTSHSGCMWIHSQHKVPCFYFFGGDLSGSGTPVNDLWIFTLSSCRWNRIIDYAGSPPPPRFKHGSCLFDNHWMLICGGLTHGWFSSSVLADMYAYDMQANCWFSVNLQSVSNPAGVELSNLTVIQSSRAVYSFGAREEGASCTEATSDVFRLSPLITFVSFSALRHQVEALDEIIRLGVEPQGEEKSMKLNQVQSALQKLRDDVVALRTENESLKLRLAEVECLVKGGSKSAASVGADKHASVIIETDQPDSTDSANGDQE
ncbi:kelch repeat-containing protein [Besnoitia besnoiti]|uniref:Kelch repeat-containing protein n=1 Tax=Besnoitia besnoiti TaxID=94643 RepID=A0A2A9M7Q6_BESBE|nr:kelch repeat-containing protein [Besnoitia besnoiti]PFH34518.1 kelch repeat-containing protein [Besnoitia besnoiti]